jgi:hypothetical protein
MENLMERELFIMMIKLNMKEISSMGLYMMNKLGSLELWEDFVLENGIMVN